MEIYENVSQLVGRTPLLELKNLEKKYHLQAKVIAKLEYLNPTGSAKDRVAAYMIEQFEKKGLIQPGATIIEPTSGNTGIGLAAIGASRGYKVILTMPDTMSKERINILKNYGAEVVLTAGVQGMAGSIAKAKELNEEIPGSIIAGQFENPDNPQAHYLTTGPEIYQDSDGQVDIFIASIGTGGTITGTGRYLKEKKPQVQVIGVEPAESPLLSKGYAGAHGIQGIGANFIPDVLDQKIYDEIITIKTEDSITMGKELAKNEGVGCGISSGAVLKAAIEVAQRPENAGKMIVVLLPDSADRYYSTKLFGDDE